MTENELLDGLLDACAVGGWLVHHDRRSDLALQQGDHGFPDIIAVHKMRTLVIAWEAKVPPNPYRPGQEDWLAAFKAAGVDARTIRPDTYDEAWEWLVGDRMVKVRIAE